MNLSHLYLNEEYFKTFLHHLFGYFFFSHGVVYSSSFLVFINSSCLNQFFFIKGVPRTFNCSLWWTYASKSKMQTIIVAIFDWTPFRDYPAHRLLSHGRTIHFLDWLIFTQAKALSIIRRAGSYVSSYRLPVTCAAHPCHLCVSKRRGRIAGRPALRSKSWIEEDERPCANWQLDSCPWK